MTTDELLNYFSEEEIHTFMNAFSAVIEPYCKQIEILENKNEILQKLLDAYQKTGYEPWEYKRIKSLEEDNERLKQEVQVLITKLADLQQNY